MSKAAFWHLATKTASTKRRPKVSAGLSGAPVIHLGNIRCTPLNNASGGDELRITYKIETLNILLDTMVDDDEDIVQGDIMVMDDVEYPVRLVLRKHFRGETYRRVIVEDLRK